MLSALTTPQFATTVTGHPESEPDHGVNETTFYTLWSGDTDTDPVSGTASSPSKLMENLANGTDIPLDSPPAAVEQWNRGDIEEFPSTDYTRSIHPADAQLTDGTYIRDAYISIFAIERSTRARLSPSDQPLYVASDGAVLGTTDYRVAIPDDDSTGSERVYWELHRNEIVETRLLVDGQQHTTGRNDHSVSVQYTELTAYGAGPHTLTLEADIEVALRKRVQTCVNRWNGTCVSWSEEIEFENETVTVQDTIDVVPYSLTVSGFQTTYPNGDRGFVVFKSQPFLGYQLPGGDVRGVWRFYVARDDSWDTLVTSTETGASEQHSPIHPLKTFAYPIETGPTASPAGTVQILDVYGETTEPPQLPEAIHLDSLTEPYTASFGIVARTKASGDLSDVTAYGLVRGVSADAQPRAFSEIPMHRSNLTLSVVNTTAEDVTVRVDLADNTTGEPIDTSRQDGGVILAGERVNTDANGTFVRTLPRNTGSIAARFEPAPWWETGQAYTGDSAVVYVRSLPLSVLSTLYQLLVPVSLFLLGVYLIDRITGWRVWPPWRWL